MWPFLHSILSRYIHGFAACVEVAFRIFDRVSEQRASEMWLNLRDGKDPVSHDLCGPMALCAHRSLLAKSSIRDFFPWEMFPFLLSIHDHFIDQGSLSLSERRERVGIRSPEGWFLSPLIRGQLNDSRTNVAEPDLLAGWGCDNRRFL
jgi:hypothetical protein